MDYNESSLPYILRGEFFKVVKLEKDGKVVADCVPCIQSDKQDTRINGSLKPTSNFTTHLRRLHAEEFVKYEEYMAKPEVKKARLRQKTIPFPVISQISSKSRFEDMIMDYIIEDMRPLNTVESEAFRKLVTGLNKDVVVMCRRTLSSRLQGRFIKTKSHIIELLQKAQFICVTADIWSSIHRSFLGVTCHWIDEDLKRRSAVLSLRRFKGKHTYDRIAEMLQDIFTSYNLTNKKIVCVVTDNGSNFVKAFKEFGIKLDDADPEQEDESAELLFNISEMLNEGILLPPHKRCASHTLSLVATNDADKALKTTAQGGTISYKSVLRSSLAKCNALWNKFSRSPQVAEKIIDYCGRSLVTPSATRWNSLFDSIRRLLEIKEKLPQIFEAAAVEKLKTMEIEFLDDYVMALQPVAYALDKLQSENDFYYGFLAPTIFQTLRALDTIIENKEKRNFTVPLAETLRAGIKTRFQNLCELDNSCEEEILAAVTHPYFKLRWVPKSRQNEMKKLFLDQAKTFAISSVSEAQRKEACLKNIARTENDNFYDFENMDLDSVEDGSLELECLSYLEDKSTDMLSLLKYPTIRAMFIRFNTALPSSAPAERLFSYGGLVLQPKRGRLSDETFEMLVYLKLNQNKY